MKTVEKTIYQNKDGLLSTQEIGHAAFTQGDHVTDAVFEALSDVGTDPAAAGGVRAAMIGASEHRVRVESADELLARTKTEETSAKKADAAAAKERNAAEKSASPEPVEAVPEVVGEPVVVETAPAAEPDTAARNRRPVVAETAREGS